MGAIAVHHTVTSDKAWDGPGNKSRLKLDQNFKFYARAFAWRDPEGDEAKKSTYKFIHHEVGEDGVPGAANIKGCQSGIGVLNGAMGGADIPDADRKGVWNHLAAHLKDAEVEPAELNTAPKGDIEKVEIPVKPGEREIRTFDLDSIAVRASGEGDKGRTLEGHAAVFNKKSEDFGGWRETIDPGAFSAAIKRDDVRALINHEPHYILGRTKAETLQLDEDNIGLHFNIDLPDTSYARDLDVSIQRGDISQCSFAFKIDGAKGEWWEIDGQPVKIEDAFAAMWDKNKHEILRHVAKARLFDVSPVTYPAYPQTDVNVRAQEFRDKRQAEAKPGPVGTAPKEGSDLDAARRRLNYGIK